MASRGRIVCTLYAGAGAGRAELLKMLDAGRRVIVQFPYNKGTVGVTAANLRVDKAKPVAGGFQAGQEARRPKP